MAFLHGLGVDEKELEFFNEYGFVARERDVINRTVDLHWHDYYELEIVTDGVGEHILNNKKYPLKCGSAYLLSPTDLHSVTGFSEFKVLNICFLNELLPEYLNNFILLNAIECEFSEAEILYITERIRNIEKVSPDFYFKKELITNIISEVILKMLEKATLNREVKNSSLIQRTIGYMMKNFKKDISLFSVAKELSVTPKYLGSCFKQNMGVSFHDYLNNLRLKFSCKLLNDNTLTVKEVAFSSGYNSVEHFLYVFKKYLKITPKEFRKSLQELNGEK